LISGDGKITLKNRKTHIRKTIRYQNADGTYSQQALREINRIFGVKDPDEKISLRLVSLLDYLEDHSHAPRVEVISGYRDATENQALKKQGRPAATTSLHLEGMAADITLGGMPLKELWNSLRDLECCGAGYYGTTLHVDTGPARFWEENTSGVEKDLGAKNRLIIARTDQDIYFPGETMEIQLARITDYPIGVIAPFDPQQFCQLIRSRSERRLAVTLPKEIAPTKKMILKIRFCQKPFPEMPDTIELNPIQIQGESP